MAELSESISVCREWLNVFDNTSMQTRLSDIYTQFFEFFTKVAIWYLKPRTSRFIDSFNSKFPDEYRDAKERIERSLQLINEQGQIENAKGVKMMGPNLSQAFANSVAQISEAVEQNRKENNSVAMEMFALLQESARHCMILLILWLLCKLTFLEQGKWQHNRSNN